MPWNDEVVETAIDSVAAACHVARRIQQASREPAGLTKADASPVTVADFAVQAILVLALESAHGPDVGPLIAGEESAAALREPGRERLRDAVIDAVRSWRAEARPEQILDAIDAGSHDATGSSFWTIDPIDGTRGFLRGNQYAICLARLEQGELAFGVLGCPNLSIDREAPLDPHPSTGVVVAAGRGAGAWERSEAGRPDGWTRLEVLDPPARAPRMAAPHVSSPAPSSFLSRVIDRLEPGADRVRLDSQCKYALVARGQADGYLRGSRDPAGECIWDHAAGTIVAEEAGAIVTDLDGRTLDFTHGRRLIDNRGVICAVPSLHPRLLEIVEELAARS